MVSARPWRPVAAMLLALATPLAQAQIAPPRTLPELKAEIQDRADRRASRMEPGERPE